MTPAVNTSITNYQYPSKPQLGGGGNFINFKHQTVVTEDITDLLPKYRNGFQRMHKPLCLLSLNDNHRHGVLQTLSLLPPVCFRRSPHTNQPFVPQTGYQSGALLEREQFISPHGARLHPTPVTQLSTKLNTCLIYSIPFVGAVKTATPK